VNTPSTELTLWEDPQDAPEWWGTAYCHFPRRTDPRKHGTFWDKVDASADCWVWFGSTFTTGYGCYWLDGRAQKAHRVAFTITGGDASQSRVLHHCDNPPCVRPDHLFAGTMADNSRDMVAKGRGPRGVEPRLSDDQVRLIRRLVRQGWTQQRVADAVGCHAVTVCNIVNGNRRADVPDEIPAVAVPA
jgi:hypothetical protein